MSISSKIRVVIMPGLHDSGPTHWQTRWQTLYPTFERVSQDDWEVPDLDRWTTSLAATLRSSPAPAIVAAHSFGCLAAVHCAASGAGNLAGALLVAPADPVKFGIDNRLAVARLSIPAILIGSENDPWMAAERAAYWAECWGSEFVTAGKLGHINAESGIGDWLFGLSQLQRLARKFSKPATQNFLFARYSG
jgi:uncharacterized protein